MYTIYVNVLYYNTCTVHQYTSKVDPASPFPLQNLLQTFGGGNMITEFAKTKKK
jgi:hypothetical protein